jgi:hypothetical protein
MSMSISSTTAARPQRSAEAAEGPGRDRVPDNDADDVKAAAPRAPAPAGMGKVVDKTA